MLYKEVGVIAERMGEQWINVHASVDSDGMAGSFNRAMSTVFFSFAGCKREQNQTVAV